MVVWGKRGWQGWGGEGVRGQPGGQAGRSLPAPLPGSDQLANGHLCSPAGSDFRSSGSVACAPSMLRSPIFVCTPAPLLPVFLPAFRGVPPCAWRFPPPTSDIFHLWRRAQQSSHRHRSSAPDLLGASRLGSAFRIPLKNRGGGGVFPPYLSPHPLPPTHGPKMSLFCGGFFWVGGRCERRSSCRWKETAKRESGRETRQLPTPPLDPRPGGFPPSPLSAPCLHP